MNKRWLPLLLLLSLLLTMTGCGRRQAEPADRLMLYFLADPTAVHGSALDTEPFLGGETPQPEELLRALLRGPVKEGLANPFPRGVTLQGVDWDSAQEGTLRVSLSEQYSTLSDISLTLADYCIVLTLSQLEEVEAVVILADGHAIRYRSHQRLEAEEIWLTDDRIG